MEVNFNFFHEHHITNSMPMRGALNASVAQNDGCGVFIKDTLNIFHMNPSCKPANTEKKVPTSTTHIVRHFNSLLLLNEKYFQCHSTYTVEHEREEKITTFENKKLDIFIFKYIIRKKTHSMSCL